MRYSAFISYSHKDRAWAAWLHRELERYRLPKALVGRSGPWGPLDRRLLPVFQDREELAASSNLADSVRESLGEASSLVVICSTNAARSRWVNEEIRTFQALGRGNRIHCLLVPEADDPDGPPVPETDTFPPALKVLGSEPLAADARKSGDGKRNAFLKLVAGITDVRFDELRQREQARRQKRLLTLAAAASIGFLLMTALAAAALVSRKEALHERDLARQKTITAQRTTDFVKSLFQVSDPSESKGQTITVSEVLDRGARQIEGELGNEPDVKAELVGTLSEVYMGLGSFRRADDLIRRSLSLHVGSPETRARQYAVLAASRYLQGDFQNAASIYANVEKSIGDPDNLVDPSLYSRALIGRAEAYYGLERFAEARPLIARALSWDAAHAGPRSPLVARDLEVRGLIEQASDTLDAARKSYSQALAIRIATQGRLHPKVSEDLNQLGTVAYFQHDSASAENYWRQTLDLDQKVLGPNHPDVGATLNNLARVMVEQRKFREAVAVLKRSASIYLAQRTDTHSDMAFVFTNLALAQRGLGDEAEAENNFRRGLTAAEVNQNRLIAPILTDLADLLCTRGRYADAQAMLDRAMPIMRQKYPDDPWRWAWVDNTRGACLLRQGNRAGKTMVETTAPVLLQRWKPNTLYGFEVERRLKAAALRT
jgi:tetratricopeptide (TPR) repeat protein